MRRVRAALEPASPTTVESLRRHAPTLDEELARANLDVRLAEYESGFFHARNPALWTGEAIFGVVSLMIRDFAPVTDRVPSIIARLNAIPRFLAAMPDAITAPVPTQWIGRAARECAAADGLFDHGLQLWMELHQLDADSVCRVHEAAERARAAFVVAAASLAALPSSDQG